MSTLDPAGWSWGRLAGATALWVAALALVAWFLVAREISHAKQTDSSGGDFIVTLPYGVRHLAIWTVATLLPPATALLRKLAAG